MGIFTTLKKTAVREKATTSEAYRNLVRAAAADDPHNKDKAVEIIDAAEKTFDEFAADVELMTQRFADAATLKESADVRADFDAAEKRVEEIRECETKELKVIRDKYRKIREKENLEQRVIISRVTTADQVCASRK